jgi:hypothetical protein
MELIAQLLIVQTHKFIVQQELELIHQQMVIAFLSYQMETLPELLHNLIFM